MSTSIPPFHRDYLPDTRQTGPGQIPARSYDPKRPGNSGGWRQDRPTGTPGRGRR